MRLSQWLRAVRVRRGTRFHEIPLDRYQVRVARTAAEYEDAFRLVYVTYASLGIENLRTFDLRMTEQHVLPEATVLVVYEDSRLIGTLSVTLDSPAKLPLDREYGTELDALRSSGARIAEIGSFAVVERCRKNGVGLLLGLASHRVSYLLHRASHSVIGIHPRVTGYYHALWGFESLGPPHQHTHLHAAVVGMYTTQARTTENLARHFRRPMQGGVPPSDYLQCHGELPGMPFPTDVSPAELTRWKMPREVFRELFVDHEDRLRRLSPATARYLRAQRSDETVPRLASDDGIGSLARWGS